MLKYEARRDAFLLIDCYKAIQWWLGGFAHVAHPCPSALPSRIEHNRAIEHEPSKHTTPNYRKRVP